MLKLAQTDRQTDRQTDQQTGQKQYVPHYYRGNNVGWGGYNVEGGGDWGGVIMWGAKGGNSRGVYNVGCGGNNGVERGYNGGIMWGGDWGGVIMWGAKGGNSMFKKNWGLGAGGMRGEGDGWLHARFTCERSKVRAPLLRNSPDKNCARTDRQTDGQTHGQTKRRLYSPPKINFWFQLNRPKHFQDMAPDTKVPDGRTAGRTTPKQYPSASGWG
ncbi:hypothetical protein DPMN_031005 [Dreissena polymorpha]|uniref:Uncharacterized protein n=1 Tax=Dreissena polymorpha TaxID=45954 RepID=A0A9D4RHM1_DREPO|nr:hypothetical protein DPMN_031005 [Dreissena polymorpha]